MSVEVKVEGAKELVVKLEKMADAAKITSGLTKGALLVERAARENCPKGTGELRRSITSKVEDTTAIIYTPLEYAPYVEYGTGLFAEVSGRVDVP